MSDWDYLLKWQAFSHQCSDLSTIALSKASSHLQPPSSHHPAKIRSGSSCSAYHKIQKHAVLDESSQGSGKDRPSLCVGLCVPWCLHKAPLQSAASLQSDIAQASNLHARTIIKGTRLANGCIGEHIFPHIMWLVQYQRGINKQLWRTGRRADCSDTMNSCNLFVIGTKQHL